MAFGHPIYLPWALFGWWFSYEAYAPALFEEAGAIAAASGLVGCAAAIFGSLWRARQRNNLTTYGSARRSEEHTSELQSLMRISYAVFCLKKKNTTTTNKKIYQIDNRTKEDIKNENQQKQRQQKNVYKTTT